MTTRRGVRFGFKTLELGDGSGSARFTAVFFLGGRVSDEPRSEREHVHGGWLRLTLSERSILLKTAATLCQIWQLKQQYLAFSCCIRTIKVPISSKIFVELHYLDLGKVFIPLHSSVSLILQIEVLCSFNS